MAYFEDAKSGIVAHKVGAIGSQTDAQAAVISELEKLFEELSGRLAPVLSNHPRAGEARSTLDSPKPSMSPLAESLAVNVDRCSTLAGRMRELLGRIEL